MTTAERRRHFALIAMVLALVTIVGSAVTLGPFSGDFMAHRHCLDSRVHPMLLWLIVLGNALVATAYYIIPAALLLAAARGLAPVPGMFQLFAAFILACGTTHLFAIWVLWNPVYWSEAAVLLVTGVISWVTVIEMFREARHIRRWGTVIGQQLHVAASLIRHGAIEEADTLLAGIVDALAGRLVQSQSEDDPR